MLVYEGTKTDFVSQVETDKIADTIKNNIFVRMHRHTADSEYRSWENSLKSMYVVLNDKDIPEDSGIAIEYNIPQTSKRVDFMISGYNDKKEAGVTIIELKQWETLKAIDGTDALVETYTGHANRRVVHPSYQAWSYAALISDYNQNVQDKDIELYPCAYLHNYKRKENDPLDAKQYDIYQEDSPAFANGDISKLRDYIKKVVKTGDSGKVLELIDCGRIKPSKKLQDSILGMLKGNKEFIMIDEQKVVYEDIINISSLCQTDCKKRTIIVEGGPGTGKSVVAVNLLVELTQRDQFCQYVSKNTAPRDVYKIKLKGAIKKSTVDNLFKGSGSYVDVPVGCTDTLIVDEAHRLNEKSGFYCNQGENQIKEIISAAKCSIFFIDESQRVTLNDIGSVAEIEKWAYEENSEVYRYKLESQFRCNGSDAYLAWLDDVLQIRETANPELEQNDYDYRVFDSPTDLRNTIIKKNNENNNSRLLAGYCWNWIKAGKNDTNVHDIIINDKKYKREFSMSWNLSAGELFAIDEGSINEIGCIHTSQGLEFDYVGVIIGRDMSYKHGKIVTDFTKRAKTDQSLKGIKGMHASNPEKAAKLADEIIKNTYRTLMTRGMKGCYVYCEDEELRDYLKDRLSRDHIINVEYDSSDIDLDMVADKDKKDD